MFSMEHLPQERLDALLQAFGREVRADRVRRGWSREELAEAAGVSAKQVGNMERGQRGQLAEAWRVAEALDRDFSAMVGAAEETVHVAVMAYGSDDEARRAVTDLQKVLADREAREDEARAARQTGRASGNTQKAREIQDRAGEPEPNDPNDFSGA